MHGSAIENSVLQTQEVERVTGLSKKTLIRLEEQGKFPLRVQLSSRSAGWLRNEVQDWIASRPRIVK